MKTKVLVGVLLFLIVVNLATLGTYLYLRFTGPAPMPGMQPGMPPKEMMSLDPQSRERLHRLMMEFRTTVRPLQQQIRGAEDSVVLLLQQDPVPTAEIDRTFRRIMELHYTVNQHAVQQLVQAKSFLNPEQQRHFFRAILDAQPRMRRGEGMGRMQRQGPDPGEERPFGRVAPMHPDSQ